jgi:hypothetical protein
MNGECLKVVDVQGSPDGECCCCGRPFVGQDLARCSICGAPFHLALRIDVPAVDCGQAWISDELEAVQFGCNRCLRPEPNQDEAKGLR